MIKKFLSRSGSGHNLKQDWILVQGNSVARLDAFWRSDLDNRPLSGQLFATLAMFSTRDPPPLSIKCG